VGGSKKEREAKTEASTVANEGGVAEEHMWTKGRATLFKHEKVTDLEKWKIGSKVEEMGERRQVGTVGCWGRSV